jgi:hypothetical protein
LKAPAKQLVLTSAHVVKLQAERFLAPEKASKGVYQLEQECGPLFTAKSPKPFGKFVYEMKLQGFLIDEHGKKDVEKCSFLVSIAMEARFDILNGAISRESELNKLCPDVIGQVHALGTMRLIAIAADLGFPGVRPRLSIARESIPKFTHDAEVEIDE